MATAATCSYHFSSCTFPEHNRTHAMLYLSHVEHRKLMLFSPHGFNRKHYQNEVFSRNYLHTSSRWLSSLDSLLLAITKPLGQEHMNIPIPISNYNPYLVVPHTLMPPTRWTSSLQDSSEQRPLRTCQSIADKWTLALEMLFLKYTCSSLLLNDLALEASETPGMDYHRKIHQFEILEHLTAWQYTVRLSQLGNSFSLFRFASGIISNV